MHRRALAGPSGATPVHPCCLLGFPFLSAPAHAHLSPPVNTVSHSAFNICPFLPTAATLPALQPRSSVSRLRLDSHNSPRGPLCTQQAALSQEESFLCSESAARTARCCPRVPRLHLTGPCRTPCPHLQTIQYIPVYFSNMPGMLSSTSGPRIVCPLISQRLISVFH